MVSVTRNNKVEIQIVQPVEPLVEQILIPLIMDLEIKEEVVDLAVAILVVDLAVATLEVDLVQTRVDLAIAAVVLELFDHIEYEA